MMKAMIELTILLVFLSTTTCIPGFIDDSVKTDKIESVKRQAQSYKWHLKPIPRVKAKKSCVELHKAGERYSDMYTIDPDGKGSFDVYCDMHTAGGGWTVFQQRIDGFFDFYQKWRDYEKGFGSLLGDFWLGLKNLRRITTSKKHRLRIDLEDFKGNKRYAEYSSIGIGTECQKYALTVGKYSGNAGDSLTYHNGMMFSTKDSDNDHSTSNCAQTYHGGWWYNNCHYSNLNGFYYRTGKHESYADGINWYHWKGYHYSMKTVSMKVKEV